jgi:hypothetical protein
MVKKNSTKISEQISQNSNKEVVTRGILKEELGEFKKEIHTELDHRFGEFKKEVKQEFTNFGAKLEVLSDNVRAIAEGLNNKVDISQHDALEQRVETLEKHPRYI